MDSNIGANLPEEERRRLHDNFDAAVSAVRREEAARRKQERPQNQGDPSIPRMIQHKDSSINGRQALCQRAT